MQRLTPLTASMQTKPLASLPRARQPEEDRTREQWNAGSHDEPYPAHNLYPHCTSSNAGQRGRKSAVASFDLRSKASISLLARCGFGAKLTIERAGASFRIGHPSLESIEALMYARAVASRRNG